MEKINYLKSLVGPAQKSEEWLSLRKNKITTSSCSYIFGSCKYSSRDDVLIEKCIPDSMKKPFETNIACAHGERYETECADLYSKIMNKTNYEFGLISYEQLNPIRKKHEWLESFLKEFPELRTDILACSPDGIAIDNDNMEEPVLIEIKCPFRRKIIIGEIPEQYIAQVQLNMNILDLEKADFIEYRPPEPGLGKEAILNIVRIYRDPEYFKKHLPILNDFWKDVEYWRKNDITNHPKFNKYLKKSQ